MYYVYSDGELVAMTTDWSVACDVAIAYKGWVEDEDSNEILFYHEDANICSFELDLNDPDFEIDIDFEEADDFDLGLGFNPYMGCFDFDC